VELARQAPKLLKQDAVTETGQLGKYRHRLVLITGLEVVDQNSGQRDIVLYRAQAV
jgi:hypothetical protein